MIVKNDFEVPTAIKSLRDFFPRKQSFKSQPQYLSELSASHMRTAEGKPWQMEGSSPGSLCTCASRRRSSLLWFFLSVPSPADWSTESNMENGRTFFSLSRKKVSPSAVVEERGYSFQKGWHNCRDKSPDLCNIYHSVGRGCFLHPSYPCTKGPGPAKCCIVQIQQGHVRRN